MFEKVKNLFSLIKNLITNYSIAFEKCACIVIYLVYISFFRAAYSRGTDRRHSRNLISRNPLKGIYEASTKRCYSTDSVLVDNPIARWNVYNRDKSRETLAISSEIHIYDMRIGRSTMGEVISNPLACSDKGGRKELRFSASLNDAIARFGLDPSRLWHGNRSRHGPLEHVKEHYISS